MTWLNPNKPRTMDTRIFNSLPDSLTIRECRVQVAQPGFRVRVLVIATTLLTTFSIHHLNWRIFTCCGLNANWI